MCVVSRVEFELIFLDSKIQRRGRFKNSVLCLKRVATNNRRVPVLRSAALLHQLNTTICVLKKLDFRNRIANDRHD